MKHDITDMFEVGEFKDEPLFETNWVDALMIATFVGFGIALVLVII